MSGGSESVRGYSEPPPTHRGLAAAEMTHIRAHTTLLYHFCRLRLPAVALPAAGVRAASAARLRPLSRQALPKGATTTGNAFSKTFMRWTGSWPAPAWKGSRAPGRSLFAARASRTDCLLVDALRMRAVRLFPRDEERQDEAVADFWGFLLAGEREGSLPILARYDGQRPLVPWLIRVFQNKHLSDLRHRIGSSRCPKTTSASATCPFPTTAMTAGTTSSGQAARDWLAGLSEHEVLILGLRLRYRLSQREVATLLGIHEGNISRQTARLRDQLPGANRRAFRTLGWTGDDLSGFIFTEMDSLLLDEPRLSADRLAALLAARGKTLNREIVNGPARGSRSWIVIESGILRSTIHDSRSTTTRVWRLDDA